MIVGPAILLAAYPERWMLARIYRVPGGGIRLAFVLRTDPDQHIFEVDISEIESATLGKALRECAGGTAPAAYHRLPYAVPLAGGSSPGEGGGR